MIGLKQYSTEAMETAVNIDKNDFIYPFLGLVGETGELCEKFKKVLRDNEGNLDLHNKDAIIKELGDVTWYLNRILWARDISFDSLTLGYVLPETLTVHECALQLSLAVNEFLLAHKGLDADDTRYHAGRILAIVGHIAWKIDASLAEVLHKNIEKLYSRRERNMIHGSGDNR